MSYEEKSFGNSDAPSLVADMIANNIYQYKEGASSAMLRSSFVAVDQLREKGIISGDEIYLVKLGVMLAALLQETVDLDIGEELTSHIIELDA